MLAWSAMLNWLSSVEVRMSVVWLRRATGSGPELGEEGRTGEERRASLLR